MDKNTETIREILENKEVAMEVDNKRTKTSTSIKL